MLAKSKEVVIEEIKKFTNVSRETIDRLQKFVDFLIDQNNSLNLIGKSTIEDIWSRHILDSAQILKYIPNKNNNIKMVDFGSGAGLPGVVLSILGAPEIHLIDKSFHKCQFLNKTKVFSSKKIFVHHGTIEELEDRKEFKDSKFDLITARALAPLDKLLKITQPFANKDTTYIFLKGKNFQNEIDVIQNHKDLDIQIHPSLTSEESRIIVIKNLSSNK